MPLEIDVLGTKQDEKQIWAIVFETKNRNEKNLPDINECEVFINKLEILQKSMDKKVMICGIYFSANVFSDSVERWLHDHDIT